MRNSNFFGAPSPGGRSVREITSREETERPPEESARQIPACSSLPGTESLLEIWSVDRTAPEQVWQAPGLREFRLAESEQILPLTGNRKPASDRGHWLQPAPCSSRRRSCPGGERGDRQSAVPADFHPVTGIANRQEDRRVRLQNRVVSTTADNHTRSREMTKPFSRVFGCSGNEHYSQSP